MQWKVLYYQTKTGDEPVSEFINGLSISVQRKIFTYLELLEQKGLLPYPYSRDIQGVRKLRELRVGYGGNIYRIFYFPHTERRFILVHGFIKKTQRTPSREIEIATRRMKEQMARQS